MITLPRLYAVADRTFGDPVQLSRDLFAGGVQLLQVRDKHASSMELLTETEEILKIAPHGARVIVNDRSDIARISGASGVHLGQNDLAPSAARRVLANDRILGYSTHNLDQALEADDSLADYIAVGPIFPTATKENPDPVLGLSQLREICQRIRKPVVAIGGITLESAKAALDSGAASVAIIGDLLRYGNIADRTQEWVRRLEC